MIIKSFIAESSSAALKQVKAELGQDAVVLNTRQRPNQNGRTMIEVTACLDKAETNQQLNTSAIDTTGKKIRPASFEQIGRTNRLNTSTASKLESTSPEASQTVDDVIMPSSTGTLDDYISRLELLATRFTTAYLSMDDDAGALRARLLDADLEESWVNELFAEGMHGEDDSSVADRVEYVLAQKLEAIATAPPDFQPGDRVVFVGPAGSGKTSVMGKLAAQLTIADKQKIRFITLDSTKVGAYDEVQNYAEILGSTVVGEATGRRTVDSEFDGITLIDTPALSLSPESNSKLMAAIAELEPTQVYMVFSALTRSRDLTVMLRAVDTSQVTGLIMTMTDQTVRIGNLMTVHNQTQAPLAFMTDSPSGVGRLNTADRRKLLSILTRQEMPNE